MSWRRCSTSNRRPTPSTRRVASAGVEWLTREVVERGNFKTWLIDTGYGAETTFSLDELRALAPCRIEEILRLEPLIERLIVESRDFDGFLDAYRGSLDGPSRARDRRPEVGHRLPLRAAARRRRPRRPRRRPSPRSTSRAARDGRDPDRVEAAARPSDRDRRRGVGAPGGPDPVPHGPRRPGPGPDQGGSGRPPTALLGSLPRRADRAAAHRLPVRPIARLPRGDVPECLRRHG